MIAKEIIKLMDLWAPPYLIDKWDNCGHQFGSAEKVVKNMLIALDITPGVIEYAIEKEVDMIITHHPFIFEPIKKVICDDLRGKMIYNIIKNEIVVFSAHSNLDACRNGVSDALANTLGIQDLSVLSHTYTEKLFKLVVFVPKSHSEAVRRSITDVGGGWIGDYSHCTFNINGIGTFMPLKGTNPYIGKEDVLEEVEEVRIETIITEGQMNEVLNSMLSTHPYEEVAYDLYELNNKGMIYGHGRIGILTENYNLQQFSNHIKRTLKTNIVKVYGKLDKTIKRVALCGGSGGDFIEAAYKTDADVLVTGDIKYHEAQLAKELGLSLIDANHYDTEKVILPEIEKYIRNMTNDNLDIYIYKESDITPYIF